MANILKQPTHNDASSYNGFDMSKYLKFSSSVGQLLPVYYDVLNPGDKITAQSTIKTRTMVLDAAAMVQIEEHIDWFFVPMEQLYHMFTEFYYGIQDFKTNFITSTPSGYYPRIFYSDLVDYIVAEGQSGNNSNSYFTGNKLVPDSLRLMDLLGIPISKITDSAYTANSPVVYSIAPILFQAYQKIYYDYYRLEDREANEVRAYNVDRFYNTGNIPYSSNSSLYPYMFRLHYCPWKKDFYTNNFISPIFSQYDNASAINATWTNLQMVNNWLGGLNMFDLTNPSGTSQGQGTQQVTTSVGIDNSSLNLSNNNSAILNTANIRGMFAVDKLLEITRRAGKHYDKQTLAHFGVDVPEGISGTVFALHSSQSEINIGDVIATATSSAGNATSALGQVGGKGYGVGIDNGFRFEAPAHGVLMAIYYARPIADYYPVGMDKLNTLVNSYDWFKPEFDNLGMQPLFAAQCNFSQDLQNNTNAFIYGWQYRYSELKNKPNTVHGALAFDPQLKVWTTGKNPNGRQLVNYLIDPTFLDTIMSVGYTSTFDDSTESTPQHVFAVDPLIHQIYFDVRKASKMSTYSLPSL